MVALVKKGENPEILPDVGLYCQAWREDYVRWYVNGMLAIHFGLTREKITGVAWDGIRTLGELQLTEGPHGMVPCNNTIYAWLASEWAQPILQEIAEKVDQVCDLETDLEWVLILRNQRRIAITGNGRDSTLAATFVANQRGKRKEIAGSGMDKRIQEIIGGGKFDGTVRATQRELRIQGQTTIAKETTITVASAPEP